MQEYTSKEAFVEEIKKTATLFIEEFDDAADKDSDQLAGKEVIKPVPGYKWNQMGTIYEGFYASYNTQSLSELNQMYREVF